jgi:hypothetical protein
MTRTSKVALGVLALLLLAIVGCEDGVDDWNSSARVVGEVYADGTHARGLEGVQVIIESDQTSDKPYEGPDRWTTTDNRGHYEGAVFLGNKDGDYNYVADLTVGYFYQGRSFSWKGGITVGPGSVFTLPPVDASMFDTLSNTGQ